MQPDDNCTRLIWSQCKTFRITGDGDVGHGSVSRKFRQETLHTLITETGVVDNIVFGRRVKKHSYNSIHDQAHSFQAIQAD